MKADWDDFSILLVDTRAITVVILSWGRAWRHDMDFGLLFEGSVHHLDMLRFLSGGDCETLIGLDGIPNGRVSNITPAGSI